VVDGADEYEDTRLFIVSPPSFKLHPGKSKKVRLGFRGKRGTPSEQTFRLIVAEVPSEVKKAEEGTSTLDVTLRHVLPVYVAPQSPGGPKLSWTVTRQGDTATLRATNSGNQRATVVSVGLHPNPNQDNTPVYVNNSLAHVLTGSWREWQVKLPEVMPPGKAVYKLTGLNQTYQLANHE
jgi:fimbrial chaperone protein